jgi:ADP-ribosylglycohydrolase
MLGAIAGDIIGSVFEFTNMKSEDFELFGRGTRFTDDSILTVATADAILHGKGYAEAYKEWGRKYRFAGYGPRFSDWLSSESMAPYGSFGNGSAMRVSPVGFAYSTLEDVLKESQRSAEVTHNHPEGIKGAQCVASAIFLARTGVDKKEIGKYIEENFSYDLSRSLDEIRLAYRFDVTCQGSVPQAVRAFLESSDWEDAVRKGISLGGDADTIGCIVGGIAQAYYKGVPSAVSEQTLKKVPSDFMPIIEEFNSRFNVV